MIEEIETVNSSTNVAHNYTYNTIGNMTSMSVDGEFTVADQYHLDFLGSITHILSDYDVDQEEQNYSNLEEQDLYKFTRRVYARHEHLTEHYLINMDGRMYDPYLGRMLSVDNYVQAPWSSVSYIGLGSYDLEDIEDNSFELSISDDKRKVKPGWGVYRVEGDRIEIQNWTFSTGCRPVITKKGVILNDTTIKITSWQNSNSDKLHSVNAVFRFHKQTSKPDSTNSFVK